MIKLEPKKISVTYIASSNSAARSSDSEVIKKALQQKSDIGGLDCPFCER